VCVRITFVQAIRVLGVLGALDPYRHKVHLGEVSLSRDSGAMSEAKPLQETSQQGPSALSTSTNIARDGHRVISIFIIF